MASKSFAQTMNNAKLMLAGLKQNPERLAKRGLDSAPKKFVQVIEKQEFYRVKWTKHRLPR